MHAKEYVIMSRAVEEGVATGWRRAHKHLDNPSPEAIQGALVDEVTNALCEVFDFPEVTDFHAS